MANSPNFGSILDEAPTEVTRPAPMPNGTYLTVVKGWAEGRVSKAGNKSVDFDVAYLAAEDDVDPDELETAGGVAGKSGKITFWLTEDAAYRLDEFHEHCGIDLSEPMSRRMRNDECINTQVKVWVKQSPSQSGDRMYANIERTLPAD